MKLLFILLSIMFVSKTPELLYRFSENSPKEWSVVDDGVMGGRSKGKFITNEEGNGRFFGTVSLENNGGFSSIRYRQKKQDTRKYTALKIRLKGDGKRYQFRLKPDQSNYHSYISYFNTNSEWQEITIAFKDLYPSFRGRKLNLPNFDGNSIEELSILIANKKAESFELILDKIELIE